MLRFLTAGESHGPGLVTIVEGLPKGIAVSVDGLSHELMRRRHGYGRGARMSIERDELEIVGGVRHGRTLGSPVAVVIRNTEWSKWSDVMAVEGEESGNRVTRPRPGHADLAGMLKYDTEDARDVLERASARETAARTVAGHLSKLLLGAAGIEVVSHVSAIGDVVSKAAPQQVGDFASVDDDPVRCLDPIASKTMVGRIDSAADSKDSLGGTFECVGFGVPVGLGSHVHYDRKLDGRLAGSMMSIPAIKAVEIGDGLEAAASMGSSAHDEIYLYEGKLQRSTNRAGGIEGGISNGEPIRVSSHMKPLSTLMQPLDTVDLDSGQSAKAVRERSDVCAVPAAAVVGEQMMSFVLADALLEKFGGDTVSELQTSVTAHRANVANRTSS